MKQDKQQTYGSVLILLSSVLYATYGVWTTLIGDFMGGYIASAIRCLLVATALFIIVKLLKKFEPLALRKNGLYLAGMFVAALFIWGPLYYAILHAGIGISMAINYASIVIGMFIFGWLFGRERLTREKIVAGSIGVVGIGLVFLPSFGDVGVIALLAAVLSGICAALTTVFSKYIHYSATQSTLALWVTSALANSVMAFIFHETIPALSLELEWIYLLLFSVVSLLASWLFVIGVKRIDSARAGILGLLEIVFSVLFGIILFYERPGIIALLGIALIVAAAGLPYIVKFKKKPRTRKAS